MLVDRKKYTRLVEKNELKKREKKIKATIRKTIVERERERVQNVVGVMKNKACL